MLVADDDEHLRLATSAVLRGAGFEVDCVTDGEEAGGLLSSRRYDLLLVDIDMPGNRRLELVRSVSALDDGPAVVIMTGHPTVSTAVDAVRLSVADYLLKPIRPNQLLESVEGVLAKRAGSADRGSNPRGPSETLTVTSVPGFEDLSRREVEVVDELRRGKGTVEIAKALFISPHTVRNHLKAIYRKVGVSSRSQLLHRLLG